MTVGLREVEPEIVKTVNQVFEEYFEIESERLLPEANVFEDLGLDSLDMIDLVVAIQKEFNVKIRDDERLREIRTLGDICQFIQTLKAERDSST